MTSILIDEPKPQVKRVTISAPERLNAFTYDMYEDLVAFLEKTRFDPDTRVVVITGAGRAFCAGHYFGRAPDPDWLPKNIGKIQRSRMLNEWLARVPIAVRNMPQPVICAVNGAAAGIGYSLVMAADLAIAAKSSKFVNAIHNAGTGTEMGMSYMLPRAVGKQKAAEILFTARAILSDEAEKIGLVLKTVPDEELMDQVFALADSIIANTPMGIWLTKQSMYLNENSGSLAAAIEIEHRAVTISQATEDAAEKRAATFEKRPAVYSNK